MLYRSYLFYLFLALPGLVFSEPLRIPSSSGGIVDKEIEQQYETKEVSPDKEVPFVEIDIPEKQLDLPESKKILLNKILLQGNKIFSLKKLCPLIKPYEGTEVSIRDINEMCRKIQVEYAKAGYFLVRVYAPAQEIVDRTLKIEVMEAKLGSVEITGNKYYRTAFILSYFDRFIGKTVNYNDLLKTLLLLNENSDLKVGTVFKKGKELGTVDMVLQVQDGRPIHLSVDTNNYGSNVTALYRSGVRADVGNVLQNGDTLSLVGVIGYPIHQLRFIDGIYRTPLNTRGSDLEFSYLYSDFHVDQLKDLHMHGKTQIAAVKFYQALQRTGRLNTDLYTSFEYKQIQNFANHQTSAFDKLRVLSLGYKVDYMDSFKGHNVFDVAGFYGIPGFLGGLSARGSKLCSRTDAGGQFGYVDANYQRIQRLPASAFLFLNFQGQMALEILPLSEEFYIGGINTVRGYPLAVALGDSGFCFTTEVRIPPYFMRSSCVPFTKKPWKEVLQFVGFVDHGEVYTYQKIFKQVKSLQLTSTGLGARVFGPYGIDFSADVGIPLGNGSQKSANAIFYFRINMRIL